MTPDPAVTGRLTAAGLDPQDTWRAVRGALAEDLRYGPDVTSAATTAPGARAVAGVVAREPGVLAGIPVALAVLSAAASRRKPPSRGARTVNGSAEAPTCCGSAARSGNCWAPNGPC